MGRKYTVVMTPAARTTSFDFFEILGSADKVQKLIGFDLCQTTEFGDAQEEQLEVTVVRATGSITSGSGGTTPTANPVVPGDAAFGGSVEAGNTTRLLVGSGTLTQLGQYTWNVRAPFEKWYPPGFEPQWNGATRMVIGVPTTPADSITVGGTAYIEEE
jgi:hypothetical protein